MAGVNENFELDTSNMDETAGYCTTLAEKMADLSQTLTDRAVELADTWKGYGSTAFQYKINMAKSQLTDIKDELYDLAESIYAAEMTYREGDMELAKSLEGVNNQ